MAELQPGELDPARQTIITVIGRKGSGKSKLARHIASTYPFDQVVVDLHGEDRPAELAVKDSGVVQVSEAPARWPDHQRVEGKPLVLYLQPDAGSPTLLEDMDAAAGLAYSHGRCMLLVHEAGELYRVHQTPPMARRALSQGRGRKVSMLLLAHRPHNLDPMVLVQSDVVICFEVPNPRDRELIANGIGWPPREFDLALAELPTYGYLLFDRRIAPPKPPAEPFTERDMRLTSWEPLSDQELAELTRRPPADELEPAP